MDDDIQALVDAVNLPEPITRGQVDHLYVEAALEGLDLPLPKSVAKIRHALSQLEELRATLDAGRPMPDPSELGRVLLANTLAGAAIDPLELVQTARLGADAELAVISVSKAIGAGEDKLPTEFEVPSVQRELLATVSEAVEKVLAEVRKLPPGTPTTERGAVHADARSRQAFIELERLTARHVELRQLHLAVVREQVEPPAALVLFADTQTPPAVAPSMRHAAIAAGPSDPLARVLWLSTDEAQQWVPDARQVFAAYQAYQASLPINQAARAAAEAVGTTP
jgi:hypothetical protein